MKSTPDQLILSLAHRPLSPEALTRLIDATGCTTNSTMREMEDLSAKKLASVSASTSAPGTSSPNSTASARAYKLSPIIHVMVTGSPSTTRPGLTFQDWEKQWTEGEQILARVVHTIGLNKFHRIAKNGEVQLKGKLIDVKNADFANVGKKKKNDEDADANENADANANARERIEYELTWIAKNIWNNLMLYQADSVKKATILYPVEEHGQKSLQARGYEMDGMEELLYRVLQKEWIEKKGPLNEVDIVLEPIIIMI